MLGAIWLGLNVIRVSAYDYAADFALHQGDYRQNLYLYAVKIQDLLIWIVRADLLFIALLAVMSLWKHRTAKIISNTKTR